MNILSIGSVSQDIFFPTNEGVEIDTPEDVLSQKKIAFELGAKYHISERHESLGGCSVNVAAGLSKLGEQVSCYTTVGDDSVGQWIKQELQKIGVGIESMSEIKDCKSDLSAIIVDEKNADRVIFSNQEANKKLKIEKEKIGSPDWIFIGDLSGQWEKNIDVIIEASTETSVILLAFNPRQKTIHDNAPKIIETIPRCEVLFVNKDEAMEVISSAEHDREKLNDEKYLVESLQKLGVKIAILTDGTRGAWGFDGKDFLHVPALAQVKAVDSTGAGDAFTSGFLASYIKGNDLATSLKWGIANSSNSVTEYGGQKGLLRQDEIEKVIENIKVEKI